MFIKMELTADTDIYSYFRKKKRNPHDEYNMYRYDEFYRPLQSKYRVCMCVYIPLYILYKILNVITQPAALKNLTSEPVKIFRFFLTATSYRSA